MGLGIWSMINEPLQIITIEPHLQTYKQPNCIFLKEYDCICTLRNIDWGEELTVSYGDTYTSLRQNAGYLGIPDCHLEVKELQEDWIIKPGISKHLTVEEKDIIKNDFKIYLKTVFFFLDFFFYIVGFVCF